MTPSYRPVEGPGGVDKGTGDRSDRDVCPRLPGLVSVVNHAESSGSLAMSEGSRRVRGLGPFLPQGVSGGVETGIPGPPQTGPVEDEFSLDEGELYVRGQLGIPCVVPLLSRVPSRRPTTLGSEVVGSLRGD